MMHQMYRQASQVVVWLGRPTQDSDRAMSLLPSIMADIVSGPNRLDLVATSPVCDQGMRLIWRPISSFFARPWWTRVWVLQEVALAPNRITVKCREAEQPWECFTAVGALIYHLTFRSTFLQSPHILRDSDRLGLERVVFPLIATPRHW